MTGARSQRPGRNGWRTFWLRRSRLEKVAAIALVLSLVLDNSAGERLPLAATILHLLTAGCFLALLFRYVRSLLSIAIWRLRNRLLITYVFIALVPIVLIAGMVGVSCYIFYGLISTYMANYEVQRLQSALALAGRAVAHDLQHGATGDMRAMLAAHLPPRAKDLQPEANLVTAEEVAAWLKQDSPRKDLQGPFQGLVRTNDAYELRAVTPVGSRYLVISAGLERTLSGWLPGTIGVVTLATQSTPRDGKQIRLGKYRPVSLVSPMLTPRAHFMDFEVNWPFTVPVFDWKTGESEDGLLIVKTRPSLMNGRLFSNLGTDLEQYPLTILGSVGILFLLVIAGSLVVGIRLTASITGAVNDLYEGTERINRGDFSYRIPVRSRDQLSGLAESFNTMTVSLERLIQESKEKERLQSELEIASQVQRQLFPKQLPSMRGLELAGICRPARVVSGDYYDFMAFDENRLALAIGDIAGKGISAALIMAGIQSALHAQLHQARSARAVGQHVLGEALPVMSPGMSPATLVAQLNRQLCESTSASTFATFFYATYDDSSGQLTYTNAGHLPPLVVGKHGARKLGRGGLVLGIMPDAAYEQETVLLHPGELLVLYTDGITEPENSYGGEFGEDRLLDLILKMRDRSPREVAQAILQAVEEWSDSPEAADDMTLLVARRL
jgi:sigma-B regulation protein RsbU (phosphoserine phosphatase)